MNIRYKAGGNLLKLGGNALKANYAWGDRFNRSNGAIDNGWTDVSDTFPEHLKTFPPGWTALSGSDGTIEYSVLTENKTECETLSMGNLTLTGSKSAGTSGDTTQRATVDGWRVSVWRQTDKTENGIYIVNHSGAWTRAEDFDSTEDIPQYCWWFIKEPSSLGTFNRRRYVVISEPPEVGVDDIEIRYARPWAYRPTHIYQNTMAVDGNITDRPAGEWCSTSVYREGLEDNFEVEVEFLQGGASSGLSAFTSQGSPSVFIDLTAENIDEFGAVLANDIGLSSGGVTPVYISRFRRTGTTQVSELTGERGLFWMNYPVPMYNLSGVNKFTIRVVNGRMAGFINDIRIVGPLDVPEYMLGRKNFGAWSCNIPSSLSPSQPLDNMKIFSRITQKAYNGSLGDDPNPVTFTDVTDVETVTDQQTIDVPYPDTEAGDRIFMVVISTPATSDDQFVNPEGWTLGHINTAGLRNSDSSIRFQLWHRAATGNESGTITLQHQTSGVNSNATKAHAFMMTAHYINPNAPVPATNTVKNTPSTSLDSQALSLWTEKDTVLWIGAVGSGDAITIPDGFTTIKEVGAGNSINMTAAYRVFDIDTVNGVYDTDDIMGGSGINGTIASSVRSIGWSTHLFHDPR